VEGHLRAIDKAVGNLADEGIAGDGWQVNLEPLTEELARVRRRLSQIREAVDEQGIAGEDSM